MLLHQWHFWQYHMVSLINIVFVMKLISFSLTWAQWWSSIPKILPTGFSYISEPHFWETPPSYDKGIHHKVLWRSSTACYLWSGSLHWWLSGTCSVGMHCSRMVCMVC
jgi:hypothetical protein